MGGGGENRPKLNSWDNPSRPLDPAGHLRYRHIESAPETHWEHFNSNDEFCALDVLTDGGKQNGRYEP